MGLVRLLQEAAAPPSLGPALGYGPTGELLGNATAPVYAPLPAPEPPAVEPDAQQKASLAVLTQASLLDTSNSKAFQRSTQRRIPPQTTMSVRHAGLSNVVPLWRALPCTFHTAHLLRTWWHGSHVLFCERRL